jgi:hypothetical protein
VAITRNAPVVERQVPVVCVDDNAMLELRFDVVVGGALEMLEEKVDWVVEEITVDVDIALLKDGEVA